MFEERNECSLTICVAMVTQRFHLHFKQPIVYSQCSNRRVFHANSFEYKSLCLRYAVSVRNRFCKSINFVVSKYLNIFEALLNSTSLIVFYQWISVMMESE